MSLIKLPTIEELKQKIEDRKKEEEKKVSDYFQSVLDSAIRDKESSLLNGGFVNLTIFKSHDRPFDEFNLNYLKYLVDELNKEGVYEIIMSDIIDEPSGMLEGFEITIRLNQQSNYK